MTRIYFLVLTVCAFFVMGLSWAVSLLGAEFLQWIVPIISFYIGVNLDNICDFVVKINRK